jgi:hypothetical protein
MEHRKQHLENISHWSGLHPRLAMTVQSQAMGIEPHCPSSPWLTFPVANDVPCERNQDKEK